MVRTLLPSVVGFAFAALATGCPKVDEWLGRTESRCIAFCALDTDENCKGRRPGEYDSCVEKCKSPTKYMCSETLQALESCQSALTCEEYRDYSMRTTACREEASAHRECSRRLHGPE